MHLPSDPWFAQIAGPQAAGGTSPCGIISVTGVDAISFLHNQLTNSVEGLQAGEMRLAGYCSPKGRLLADIVLWRDDVESVESAEGVPRLLLLVNQELLPALQKRLTMFVLRAKAKLADASGEFAVFGCSNAPENLPEKLPENARRMALVAGLQHVVCPASAAESTRQALLATHAEAPGATWQALRIAQGVPHIHVATQDKFVPQMVNFELIGGVDFKKGCFPGQEVVARSQYLGKMKRRSFLAHVNAAEVHAGAALFAAGGEEIGTVVNAVAANEGFNLLAELPTEQAEGARLGAPDGPALNLRALPYDIPVPNPMVRPKL